MKSIFWFEKLELIQNTCDMFLFLSFDTLEELAAGIFCLFLSLLSKSQWVKNLLKKHSNFTPLFFHYISPQLLSYPVMPEGEKMGVPVVNGGQNLPTLVGIGLTDLPVVFWFK